MRPLSKIVAALRSAGGESAISAAEVLQICHEVRRVRGALATVAAQSANGHCVRSAHRALKQDLLGVDDPATAMGFDGFAIRPIKTFIESSKGHGEFATGLTRRELRVLITELQRLRRALFQIGKDATSCPRTRKYAERILARSPWAAQGDAATYPQHPDVEQ